MQRLIFAVAVILASAVGAQARVNVEPVAGVIESASSTMTIQGIAIASAPATSVIVSTSMLYKQICVQNLDTTAYLSCGETVNVSTTAASASAGVFISSASAAATTQNFPYCFGIPAGSDFFCRSSSITGSSRAVTIRKR